MMYFASICFIVFIMFSMPFHGTRRAAEQILSFAFGSVFFAVSISFAVYLYTFMPFGIIDIFFSFIFRCFLSIWV